MRGIIWTEEEIQILVNLRSKGYKTFEVAGKLGRTRDSVAQIIRRRHLSDPRKSGSCKSAVRLTHEQHAKFIDFIKQYSTSPLDQLRESWNASAIPLGWPKLSNSYIFHWIKKLNLPHSWKMSTESKWSENKRKRKKNEIFLEKMEAFKVWYESEQEYLQEMAKKVSKKTPRYRCLCCNNNWPLNDDFYSHLTNSFFSGTQRLETFQRGFCKFCDISFVKELTILREHDKVISHLLDKRKRHRRMGFDLVFNEFLDSKIKERHRMLGSRKLLIKDCRVCVRCNEPWPLTAEYFQKNRGLSDGTPTFRGLCRFCDNHYLREIDRRKRDGRDYNDIRLERSNYLKSFRRKS